ncbi:hypothetical protein CEUSTIGMA_g5931.t1 [Chlamydomonas eustigma]|uniref:Uncharacterized protein n=1 Tax=Chlamydomonas eustigma TaxID=1157962 RepID=A0A250X6H8_9CHLO|nr:hypothetical protein CEUSTIGMA_g5931.t1 [Chlamydomonas eustigma]|eukprot:GAX78492.1 hypothetical protein CEUSTIGMA_g5931.t1 [Chlamydomonas eustigma]
MSWNKRSPAALADTIAPVTDARDAIADATLHVFIFLVSSFLCYKSASSSSVLGYVLPWKSLAPSTELIRLLCCSICTISAVRAGNIFSKWYSSRRAAMVQKQLPAAQRKLMGLPAAPVLKPSDSISSDKQRRLPSMAAAAGSVGSTPLPTPVRFKSTGSTPAITAGGASAAGGLNGREDWLGSVSPSPLFNIAPASAPEAVATAEQLTYYLDLISDRQQQQQGAHIRTGEPSGLFGIGGMTDSGSWHGAYTGIDSNSDQNEYGTSPMLPVGVDAPKYRPSWLPRARAAVAAPDVLTPSGTEEAEEFMRGVLGVELKGNQLETWVENLREWMSRQVMVPLVASVESAHEHVNQILLKYNEHQVQLPPIPEVILESSDSTATLNATSSLDVESLIQYNKNKCQAMAAGQMMVHTENALALSKALVRYESLIQLLRGKLPGDLLPPVRPGYVWNRVQALAQGTCLPEYQWAGGGASGGRPWTPDLPTDTALVLYLFAAFIESPGWDYSNKSINGGIQTGSRGMPLFLGQIQNRPPNQYSAILTHRPEKQSSSVDAILGLNLSGSVPLMCFLAEGRILALSGYQALFHVIILFVLYHKQRFNSALGNHFLHDPSLDLVSVIMQHGP